MLDKCPVCDGKIRVSRVYCEQCGTTITGQLGLPAPHFRSLNEEQIHFVLTFLRCEGKLNRMEEELNLSYPTLKNRLNEILVLLGLEEGKDGGTSGLSKTDRIGILEKLNQGEISPEEAEKILSGNG
jgi:hypothetical protein